MRKNHIVEKQFLYLHMTRQAIHFLSIRCGKAWTLFYFDLYPSQSHGHIILMCWSLTLTFQDQCHVYFANFDIECCFHRIESHGMFRYIWPWFVVSFNVLITLYSSQWCFPLWTTGVMLPHKPYTKHNYLCVLSQSFKETHLVVNLCTNLQFEMIILSEGMINHMYISWVNDKTYVHILS